MTTILCVEDEQRLRSDIVDELTEAGYSVLEAQDGEEALASITKHHPDLVLCDIAMPKIDGFKVLKHVRDHMPRADQIPFIFLSAYSDREHILFGLDKGGDDYLTKPIDFDLLLAKVKVALRHSQRMQDVMVRDRVKILKALTETTISTDEGSRSSAVAKPRRKTVVLIGKRSERTSIAHQVLQGLGHQVLVFRSGKSFLEQAMSVAADSIILDFYSDDCQAPMLSKLLGAEPQLRAPMMLLWPSDHGQPPANGSLCDFETILPVPPSPSAEWLQQTLDAWLCGQGNHQIVSATSPLKNAPQSLVR